LPPGVSASFAPAQAAPGAASILTLSAAVDASAAIAACDVTAAAAGLIGVAPLRLHLLSAPSAAIVSPRAGSEVRGVVRVVVVPQVSAGTSPSSVGLILDGEPLPAGSLDWDTSLVADGPHRLSAAVVDAAGNSALAPAIEVRVHNDTPSAPPAGCSSPAPSPAALLALLALLGRRLRPPKRRDPG